MESLTRHSLRHPALTLGLLGAISLVAAAGLPRLSTDVGYRAFLGADHPSVRRFDDFLARFDGGLAMAAVWSCDETPRCESVFDAASLEMAYTVVKTLEQSDAVRRVEGPATARLVVPTPFGPTTRRFVEGDDGAPVDDADLLAERASRDPGWRNLLVSQDKSVAAVVVELPSSDSKVALAAYRALDSALTPFEDGDAFRFHRVGGPVEFVVAAAELERATTLLIPLMVLLVGATLLVLFRSLAAAVLALLPIGVAVLWTVGLLGWLGWPQNSLTQALAPLVLVIGVCDGIHLLSRYASEGAKAPARRVDAPTTDCGTRAWRADLLQRAARDVELPCLMTSLTTAAGFLSFATASLESFVHFGIVAAAGVMAALVLTFSLLPLMLHLTAPDRIYMRDVSGRWEAALQGALHLSERRGRVVLTASLLLAAICSFGMTRLEADASFEDLYGARSRVVLWSRFVAEHLRRPETLEIDLLLPESLRISDPRALATIARLERRLAEFAQIGPARSLLGPISWYHRLIRNDDPSFERPGDSEQENRALISMATAFGAGVGEDGLASWLSHDRRHVRISLEAGKSPQIVMRQVMTDVRRILEQELPPGWYGAATGPYVVVHDMIDAIRSTQLRSFLAAGLAVLALLAIFLGSTGWALLALIPAVLPVVTTLGAMGLLGIRLDVGSAMVAAVVLGVAVDDIIHLLDAFRRRRRSGVSASAAMRGAATHVGRALVTTSIALAVGFAALALSPWQTVANFGLVSAIAILAALVSTLLVLPALFFALPDR